MESCMTLLHLPWKQSSPSAQHIPLLVSQLATSYLMNGVVTQFVCSSGPCYIMVPTHQQYCLHLYS